MQRKSNLRRIVVTGMGMVSPLGCGVEPSWARLIAGQSGLRALSDNVSADCPPRWSVMFEGIDADPEAGFDPDRAAPRKDQRKMDRFIQFALLAADEAVAQAGWKPEDERARERTATIIASGVGGFPAIVDAVRTVDERGVRRLSPFIFVPAFLVNLAAGQISIRHGFKGQLGAPVTACAASVQAIGDAARLILAGEADVAVCGGAEGPHRSRQPRRLCCRTRIRPASTIPRPARRAVRPGSRRFRQWAKAPGCW